MLEDNEGQKNHIAVHAGMVERIIETKKHLYDREVTHSESTNTESNPSIVPQGATNVNKSQGMPDTK